MPAPVGRNSFWPSIINLMKKKNKPQNYWHSHKRLMCYEAGQAPYISFPVLLTQSNKTDFEDHYYFCYFLNTALTWGFLLQVSRQS